MANFKGLLAKGPPETPIFVLILRIVALVFSLAVFIAACYNASTLDRIEVYTQDEAGPAGLGIFTCIWTWGVVGTEIAFTMLLPHWYLRILFFILDILTIIFWLCTWAVSASAAGDVLKNKGAVVFKQYGGSAAAMAGLGAITWVILIVVLVFWTMAAIRGSPEPTTSAELGTIKTEGAPAVAAPGAQPQQYPPQQYPPQQYPPQNGTPYAPEQGAPPQYPPQQYPSPQGTPQPYGQQQPYPAPGQSPYSNPGSPAPGQQGPYSPQQGTPYPPGELQGGYPQEPQHPQQPPAHYPQ